MLLNNQTRDLKTFVANRVAQIHRESFLKNWRHVPSALNAADPISRGLNIDQLNNNTMWWQGPAFLKENEDLWPQSFAVPTSEAAREFRQEQAPFAELDIPTYCVGAVSTTPWNGMDLLKPTTIGTWRKLVRVTAYVLRVLSKEKPSSLALQPKELERACRVQFRLAQREDGMK